MRLSYILCSTLCLIGQSVLSQSPVQNSVPSLIPEDALVTAAFATGGQSEYLDTVLWLTWGAQNSNEKYGAHGRGLKVGDKSYARIPLGGANNLEVVAEIVKVERYNGATDAWDNFTVNDVAAIQSYRPGSYKGDGVNSGDFLDDLYNIGGTDEKNQLVSGIAVAVNGSAIRFSIKAKALLNGKVTKLPGLVIGDAESLSAGGQNAEYIYAKGVGVWTVVDVLKNPNTNGVYHMRKLPHDQGVSELQFLKGNDQRTGAVGFLTFSEQAYRQEDGDSVNFDVELKGGGIQAVAVGVIPPALDGGDAPESYGAAWHVLDGFVPGDDGIPLQMTVNVNAKSYIPGGLLAQSNLYLGSTPPDSDGTLHHSPFANGDDITGPNGALEEDAWPSELKIMTPRFYEDLVSFSAEIPYILEDETAYIAGWIDLDNNGIFDSYEKAIAKVTKVEGTNKGSVILKWDIPTDRKSKNTFVRLRMAKFESDLKDPTGFALGGEVEDHRIYIVPPTITNPMLPNQAKGVEKVNSN